MVGISPVTGLSSSPYGWLFFLTRLWQHSLIPADLVLDISLNKNNLNLQHLSRSELHPVSSTASLLIAAYYAYYELDYVQQLVLNKQTVKNNASGYQCEYKEICGTGLTCVWTDLNQFCSELLFTAWLTLLMSFFSSFLWNWLLLKLTLTQKEPLSQFHSAHLITATINLELSRARNSLFSCALLN